ncbi:hypothetical protein C8J56DRAFT_773655 [Mycena floridula]|nr:hypothetical protein C8J56DRAFT_773655 [Mycena floridula]
MFYLLITLFFNTFTPLQAAAVNPPFTALSQQTPGGFDFLSANDKSFAFDYQRSGKADHIVAYRPGSGVIYIVNPALQAVVSVNNPGTGLGGFDLSNVADLAFPYDFDSSGFNDHILFFRPGTGLVTIIRNTAGSFDTVFTSNSGIGDYDLLVPSDVGLSFDYGGTGKQDHLVFYRPGQGAIFIIKHNADNTFSPVYSQGAGGVGLGSYDLSSPADKIFAFDYDGKGLLNYLVLYRPGTGKISIQSLQSGGFFQSVLSAETGGLGGYDLQSANDLAFAYDFTGSGLLNHIAFYRPGGGAFFIIAHSGQGTFSPVFQQTSGGIGGFDFVSTADRAYAYDHTSSGALNAISAFRPGEGKYLIIVQNTALNTPSTTTGFQPTFAAASTGVGGDNSLTAGGSRKDSPLLSIAIVLLLFLIVL